jgi:hypothetical protein
MRCEGNKGTLRGALQEIVIGTDDRLDQLQLCNLLDCPLQGEGKQRGLEGVVPLPQPNLGVHHQSRQMVHGMATVSAVDPCNHGQQGQAALLDSCQHFIPA